MDKRRAISHSRSAGMLLVAIAWALLLTLAGSPETILFTVPVFLLAAPLAFGRYVGEEFLDALRARPRRRPGTAPEQALTSLLSIPRSTAQARLHPGRSPPLVTG